MRLSTMALIFLTATLCSSCAFAANQTRVDIPFSFSAQGKPFPPGPYDISIDGNLGFISLTNKDAPGNFIVGVTNPADHVEITTRTVLTFRADGPSYSLEAIQMGRRSTSFLSTRIKSTTLTATKPGHDESPSTYSDAAQKVGMADKATFSSMP